MITVLSPSKTLNENPRKITDVYTMPSFLKEASELVGVLKKYNPEGIQELMSINPKLATLNVERYIRWNKHFTEENAARAILMFKGEVFNGLKADTLKEEDLLYAQDHLRVISGLYGVLRPLDLIQPYRLEMGTALKTGKFNNLYDFWGSKITDNIHEALDNQKQQVLVNLASDEYFNAIDTDKLNARIIKCQFKEERDGKLKFITIYGKKARGLMTRHILQNRIEDPENLKAFDEEGYFFSEEHSSENMFMFVRLS